MTPYSTGRFTNVLTLCFCLILSATFYSCGEDQPSETDEIETSGDSVHVVMEVPSPEEEIESETIREDMEHLSRLDSLNIQPGTVEASIAEWIRTGDGSKTFILDQVPFDGNDDDELTAEGRNQLDAIAAMLVAYPELSLEVEGHTSKAKNAIGAQAKKAASAARALWVKTKISLRGVDGKQLSSTGYGDEQLLPGLDPEDPAQKRISVKISK